MNNQNINEAPIRKKQKLNVSNYVFEIDGKDIIKAEVEYELSKFTTIFYKDGKRDRVEYFTAISIEVTGIDDNNNEAWFCFELDMSLEQLNTYPEKPVNITEFVSSSEAFIKKPNMESSRELDFYFPKNTIEDIYHNLTSIWVVKKDINTFMFKVCVPSDYLFAFFEVNFNNE